MAQEDRLERLFELIGYLLGQNEAVTRQQLTNDFPFYSGESGRRRFEDDKKSLHQIGVALETDHLANGAMTYRLRRQDYALPDLDLTDDESVALSLALAAIDIGGVLWSQLAGTKLGFAASPVPTLAVFPGLELLPLLAEAARSQTRLRVNYNDKVREIDPYGVVAKNGHWYVPSFDSRRQSVVPFRVDRMMIGSVSVVAHAAFTTPSDIDLGALVPGEGHAIGEGRPTMAEVRIDRRFLGVVAVEWPDAQAPEPCDGGEMIVRVPVRHPEAFVSQVLSFGDRVVVEGPDDLRSAVVARLRALAHPVVS